MEPTILSPSGIDLRKLDRDAIQATQRLIARGYEAYLVGGCVRDLLLERSPKDYDIATEARPQQVKRTFPRNCRIIGRRFKLAHLHFHNNTKILEVSTFRRTPQETNDEDLLITRDNEFGTAEEDALRRDFTVNALFLDPSRNCILDYTNGLEDVRAKVIRTIGDPRVRFREDPVRILRAAKFAGRLGFHVEDDTLAAMAEVAPDLMRASAPRLLEEILRLLRGGHALDSFQLLRDIGAMRSLLPIVAEFLGRAPQPDRVGFWRLLEALDHVVHQGRVPANPVLLGTLFATPVGFETLHQPGRSPTSIAEELLGPLSTTLRLSRRDAGCLKRICGVQHRFPQLEGQKRFKVQGFLHGPYFWEALDLFELQSLATGIDPAMAGEWQALARAEGVRSEYGPRPAGPRGAPVADHGHDDERPTEPFAEGETDDRQNGPSDEPNPYSGPDEPEAGHDQPFGPADAQRGDEPFEPGRRRRRRRRRRGRDRGDDGPSHHVDPNAVLPDIADGERATPSGGAPAEDPDEPPPFDSRSDDDLRQEPTGLPAPEFDDGSPASAGEPGEGDGPGFEPGRRRRRRRRRRGQRDDAGDRADRSSRQDAATEAHTTAADAEDHPARSADLGADAPTDQSGPAGDAADEIDRSGLPAPVETDPDGNEPQADHQSGHGQHEEGRRGRRRRRRGRDRDRGHDPARGPDGQRRGEDSQHGQPGRPHGHPGQRQHQQGRPQHGQHQHGQPQHGQRQHGQPQSGQHQQSQHQGQHRHGQGRPQQGPRGQERQHDRNRQRAAGRDVDVVSRHQDRRGKVEVIEPPPLDLTAFDVELDPKRVPTFGSIVEGKGRPKRRAPRLPDDSGIDDYKPPPPPGGGDAPPPAPPPEREPDTFGDW
ncbi:MAG: polynucleotide adenylyltransferase PcnB [Planctomycetes bacterium]|nr:polynucleotide adenylyltransferase PcnB [Planctomycetota bacterium]